MFDIVILYNRSNAYGLQKDAAILEETLTQILPSVKISQRDPLEPPQTSDICIHLEQPSNVWLPWSRYNVLIVNPEWYIPEAYNAYLPRFDRVIFKNKNSHARFCAEIPNLFEKSLILPWAMGEWTVKDAEKAHASTEPGLGFAAFLGASKNRHAFMAKFLPFWRESYPSLNIFTTGAFDLSGALPENVKIHRGDLDEEKRYKLATFFPGNIVVSDAEGFSYTAAEAEAVGAYSILNTIESFICQYDGCEGVGFFPNTQTRSTTSLSMVAMSPDPGYAQPALDELIREFMATDIPALREKRRARAVQRKMEFVDAWRSLFSSLVLNPTRTCPPVLPVDACPPISVVTLIYNRKRFFDLACHNIMIQDYPKDKIEWILVDDSDDPMEQNTDKIIQVQNKSDPLKIVYVPLTKKASVSDKRNVGCRRATASIILMMDDDDHYPSTSFRRRVSWLTQHLWQPRITACTTIACYDLVKAISAVNVPPFDIPVSERISEATLTFYKSVWEAKPFPKNILVGEGEAFLSGREAEFLEMPPQQIIVAFSHGKNTSSRRVPEGADVKPGCFWGFPREFLVFIHGLAGIKITES